MKLLTSLHTTNKKAIIYSIKKKKKLVMLIYHSYTLTGSKK